MRIAQTICAFMSALVIAAFFGPFTVFVYAVDMPPDGPPGTGPGQTTQTQGQPPTVPGGSTQTQGQNGTTGGSFQNPISSETLPDLVKKIANVVASVGIPLIAIFIIYAGFLFVTSQGDPKKLETAKTTLTYAVIGGIVIIGAYAIATAIVNFAQKL